ncbi:MAG: chromosome partitioning protein ParA [Bacteroidetes bacterium CG_4_9_14_3_um_filter_41_19]|nr:MAG: chromosome partitioning protein ParA [Bacteroidetes bacterium CG_4_9_14_3_um_filter_41_19]
MRIVFFNHKGGVSKTTTTFHLGWKLAERGSKVLLVDADPQCNLSGLIMGEDFESYYINDLTKNQNLMDGVRAAFEGKPQPISAVDCYTTERNTNLFLLPGHPNLTELEPQLSFAQTAQNVFATMQNLPGSFNALISNTCNIYNIEYVLIDLNPGLSAINQNLFSITDLFIIPTNPDPFSLMAISTLSSVIPRWGRSAEQMTESFKDSSYPFPETHPKLGGIVIQRFNVRNGQATAPFRDNMNEIISCVKDKLIPSLTDNQMTFEINNYRAAGIPDNLCIAEIPDFQSLLPKSHSLGIPVFALTDDEIDRTGTVLDQMIIKRDQFNAQFEEFAEKIELLSSDE